MTCVVAVMERKCLVPIKAFTLIELLVCLATMSLCMALVLPAIAQAREAANRITCQSNLRQIGIALHARHNAWGSFPAGRGAPAPKIFSPHAAILGFVEQDIVHKLIDFEAAPASYTAGPVAYDGSRNLKAAYSQVPLFHCPSAGPQTRVRGSSFGSTAYAANAGSGRKAGLITDADGVFFLDSVVRTSNISDGTTHTAAFSERMLGEGAARRGADTGNPRLVMREIPIAVDPSITSCSPASTGNWNHERGAKWIVGNYGNTLYNHALVPNSLECDCINMTQQKARMAARSYHPGGVNVLFCDGHVDFVGDSIEPTIWQAMSTRDSGELMSQ